MPSNTQIQHDVLDELTFEPSINATNIGVIAKDGVVTLTGTVKSYAEKTAATEAAERVFGVKAVAVEMKVDLTSHHERNDADIAKAAVNALKWHVWVPSDEIKVKVEQGWVTVEGTVDHQFQKRAAEDAVETLTGIRGVNNLITLNDDVVASSDIRTKIESALKRAAELEGKAITVEVDGNNVTLRGTVSSSAERDEAERAAWSAPGVWSVDDQLEIAA